MVYLFILTRKYFSLRTLWLEIIWQPGLIRKRNLLKKSMKGSVSLEISWPYCHHRGFSTLTVSQNGVVSYYKAPKPPQARSFISTAKWQTWFWEFSVGRHCSWEDEENFPKWQCKTSSTPSRFDVHSFFCPIELLR